MARYSKRNIPQPAVKQLTQDEKKRREKRLEAARRDAPAEEFAFRALLLHRLWSTRVAAKLTQSALAERIGRSQKAVSDIETGRTDLTLESLLALARELELNRSRLFDPPDTEVDDSDDMPETRLHSRVRVQFAHAQRKGLELPTIWEAIQAALSPDWRTPR